MKQLAKKWSLRAFRSQNFVARKCAWLTCSYTICRQQTPIFHRWQALSSLEQRSPDTWVSQRWVSTAQAKCRKRSKACLWSVPQQSDLWTPAVPDRGITRKPCAAVRTGSLMESHLCSHLAWGSPFSQAALDQGDVCRSCWQLPSSVASRTAGAARYAEATRQLYCTKPVPWQHRLDTWTSKAHEFRQKAYRSVYGPPAVYDRLGVPFTAAGCREEAEEDSDTDWDCGVAPQFGLYRSAAQLAHGWPGSNAEPMQALMFANQATVKVIVAQILLLSFALSVTMYMLLQQALRAALQMCA